MMHVKDSWKGIPWFIYFGWTIFGPFGSYSIMNSDVKVWEMVALIAVWIAWVFWTRYAYKLLKEELGGKSK